MLKCESLRVEREQSQANIPQARSNPESGNVFVGSTNNTTSETPWPHDIMRDRIITHSVDIGL